MPWPVLQACPHEDSRSSAPPEPLDQLEQHMTPGFGFDALFSRSGADSEPSSTHLTPRPRRYAGTEFRSTLEADWAATLDSLGVAWDYEPKTVTLPSGIHYLPDFHLREIGVWLEVKGDEIPGEDKAVEFARYAACRCESDCYCQWPGGEIVIVGRSPYQPPGQRLRYGAARWYDLLAGNALLATCLECYGRSWVRPRVCLACRRCGAFELDGSHIDSLLNVGDIVGFHRADRLRDSLNY